MVALMSVAVIIPLFNGAEWIRFTLASVLAQTHPPAEILVVNDHSTDNSAEIVKKFPKVRLVDHPEKGANLARRFGTTLTDSPLIAMLDQDDIWHPQHLHLLVQWLTIQERCRAVCATECDISRTQPQPNWNLSDLRRESFNAWKIFPFGPRIGSPSAVLIRRNALDEIGGWPTEFPGMADYFTWLGVSANGTPRGSMAASRGCTMARRRHQSSYSSALRTGDALATYSKNQLRASRAAAERFGALSPLDIQTLAQRLDMAESLHQIVLAFIRQDWDSFRSTVHHVWTLLDDQPLEFRRKFGSMVCWLFDGRRPRAEAIALFDRVLTCWPAEDLSTRQLLQRRRDIYAA